MSRPRPYTDAELARQVEVLAVAHCIRLGKQPEVGCVLDFAFQLKDFDTVTHDVTLKSDKLRLQFRVTQSHLEEAIAQINAQEIRYREPKLSYVGDELPEGLEADDQGNLGYKGKA